VTGKQSNTSEEDSGADLYGASRLHIVMDDVVG
jgi:hypothetical protein